MFRTIGISIIATVTAVGASGCTLAMPQTPMEQIVLQVPPGADPAKLVTTIEERLDALGAAHSVEADGTKITVGYAAKDVPGGDDVFTRGGEMTLRPVLADAASATTPCPDAAADEPCAATNSGEQLALGPASPLGIADAEASVQGTDWTVDVEFTASGGTVMQELSAAAACARGQENRIALVLDGEILTAPSVALECGESLQEDLTVSGGFDRDDAMLLAAVMASPMPAGVTVVEPED